MDIRIFYLYFMHPCIHCISPSSSTQRGCLKSSILNAQRPVLKFYFHYLLYRWLYAVWNFADLASSSIKRKGESNAPTPAPAPGKSKWDQSKDNKIRAQLNTPLMRASSCSSSERWLHILRCHWNVRIEHVHSRCVSAAGGGENTLERRQTGLSKWGAAKSVRSQLSWDRKLLDFSSHTQCGTSGMCFNLLGTWCSPV